MTVDLAVTGGRILNPSYETTFASRPGTVAVEGGRITGILDPADRPSARETIDATGMLVLPGGIDPHFHCRAPSFPERGDFATESRAAAAGGVTTIFEMPISKPGVATTQALEDRGSLVVRDAHVNIALYGAPGLLAKGEVDGMAKAGAIAFKLFMTEAPPGREDEFEGLIAPDLATIGAALELTRATGLRCAIHCEDQSLIDWYTRQARGRSVEDWQRNLMSRPAVVETAAVAGVLQLAQFLEAPVHIVHASAEASVDLIRAAKHAGTPVTAETCPHYLLFTNAELERVGPYGKINPPMRQREDQDALWRGLHDGVLDFVATDHAPFTAAEKEAAWGNIIDAPPGHPGVEALVPLLLTWGLKGTFTLERSVELLASNAARSFGLYPRKGVLRPGADADICVFDPRRKTVLNGSAWLTKGAEASRLYRELPVGGSVHATVVGGRVVYREGCIIGQPGCGAWLRPDHTD